MKDPEFVLLRNRFLVGISVAIIFAIPLFVFLYKVYGTSDIVTKLNKSETFTLLVTSNDCDKCNLVDDILKEYNVDYLELNSSKNKDYQKVMNKFELINKREKFPVLIYVEDGKMKANLFNINTKDDVTSFLDFHGLVNSK